MGGSGGAQRPTGETGGGAAHGGEPVHLRDGGGGMTTTRVWLDARRQRLQRLELSAGTLLTTGLVLVALGAGVVLARRGVYLRAPWALLLMWLAPAAVVAGGVWWYRRRAGGLAAPRLAAEVEEE